MNRLKHTVVLELPTDYEHVLVSLWKLGLDRDPVKYTLRELKVVFHYDTSEEHQMIRMIKSSDTLMFALISLHQMIAPPYSIASTTCGSSTGRNGVMQPMAFAQNQRDEVRDLHDVAGALGSQPGMKQQTFVAVGVVTKGNGDCFLTEDVHTSLTSGGGQAGQGYPCVLCLNDQGGQFMDCSENVAGTLRAQMHSHQPLVLESNQEHATVRSDGVSPTLPASMGMGGGYVPMVYENHGIDSRYTGPHSVVPTISARCGTGGNNVPLVGAEPEVYCIVGNVIDREPENGGNGCGYQQNISYTLTAMDRHAVFSRQRTDVFAKNSVVSTESARQHKDATDLIMQPYQETVGTLVRSDHKGISNQYVNDDNGFYLAGIYRIEEGKPVFTILTSAAAEGISFIHERMPVILPSEATTDWLNPRYHGNDILRAALTEMEYKAC